MSTLKVQANGTKENDSYILDMSTSSVAVGKIEIQLRKKEQLPSKGALALTFVL